MNTDLVNQFININPTYTPPNLDERSVPEGFCVTCKSYTTAYNIRGECSVCGTGVCADISEGEAE